MAQTFGQTFDDLTDSVTPSDDIVYAESGDDNPNNCNDSSQPPDDDGSDFDPTEDTGVADPTNDGLDEGINNEGLDDDPNNPGGEDNVVAISGSDPSTPADDNSLHGPFDAPNALNRTDDDDFTNAASDPLTNWQ